MTREHVDGCNNLLTLPTTTPDWIQAVSHNQTDLEQLTEKLIAFRDERDWRQFHSLKNLILSLNLEASELLELTQWKSEDEVEAAIGSSTFSEKAGEECADILLYLLLIAERAGLDLVAAANAKIAKNALKYPVEKSRGNARKYTEL